MPDIDTARGWEGRRMVDGAGNKIGTIGAIYVDTDTEQPEWAVVDTGLFGTKQSFVPLVEAADHGGDVRVPYDKNQVKDAPRIDPDGELSEAEEADLYRYYGLDYGGAGSGSGSGSGTGTGRTNTGTAGVAGAGAGYAAGRGDRGTVGHDTSGPTTDNAMTRSEEEIRVGTRQREAGRARLRKYIVTENVTTTVPVRREEVRVEREPITDANRDAAYSGSELSEEEHEVVLREEEAVVEKRVVPKERVRLDTETVVEEQQVSDTVRKERIEVEGDTTRDTRDRRDRR